jgi:hypothetical protein
VTGVEATSAFAGEPQPVEVFFRGVWYSGELLGWRHDEQGRCLARVRCRVNGLRHSAWVDLADLRLPGTSATDEPAPVAVTRSRPPVPPSASPPTAAPAPVRQRVLDDETQPHVLLPLRRSRPKPAVATLPPPRYPRPSEQQFDVRRAAAV